MGPYGGLTGSDGISYGRKPRVMLLLRPWPLSWDFPPEKVMFQRYVSLPDDTGG